MAIDAKLQAIAAKLEDEIYRSGETVGRAWPFLSMAIDMAPDVDTETPLVSMARSAAHALRREGFKLNSPLISEPALEDRDLIYSWFRKTGRQPNAHWASMSIVSLLDEHMARRTWLRGSRFSTDTGLLNYPQKAEFLPTIFGTDEAHTTPQILEILPL